MAIHIDDNTGGKPHSQGPQGVVFGIFIGAAFIGAFVAGWMLAKNNSSRGALDYSPNVIVPGYRLVSADPHADFASPISVPVAVPEPQVPDVAVPGVAASARVAPVVLASPQVPAAVVLAPRQPEPDVPLGAVPELERERIVEPARLVITTELGVLVFQSILENGSLKKKLLGTANKAGRLEVLMPMDAREKTVDLILEKDGMREEQRKNVVLTAGKATALAVALRSRAGILAVVTSPASAEVYFNGTLVGRGFVLMGEIKPGVAHNVEVRLPGQKPVRRKVVVEPDKRTVETFNLVTAAPDKGDILFLGAMQSLLLQAGVQVLLDGKAASHEQGLLRNVAPGEHSLLIQRAPAKSGSGAPVVLWERRVRIEAGSAVSFGDDDVAPLSPKPAQAVAGKPSAVAKPAQADEKKAAHLALNLLDDSGLAIAAEKISVSFNGNLLSPLAENIWPIPLRESGVLRVQVLGFLPEERMLHYSVPGQFRMAIPLQKSRVPVLKEWTARVLSASADTGLLILGNDAAQTLLPGQRLLLSALKSDYSIQVIVSELKQNMVICQVQPGGTSRPVLPERNSEVRVSLANTQAAPQARQ
ncbi:MAG: PEGA domain-containing protein [Puniceicoccales bacterium]|jgi:hypothetical protein|nr:PEGA domain-containing protein [Puniceicoccales bacterium]